MKNNHDPYLDEKSGTLKNKFGVLDSKLLDNLENDIIPGLIIYSW